MAEQKEANDKLEEGLRLLEEEGGKSYPNMDELPVFTDGIVLANIRKYYECVREAPIEPPTSGDKGWSPIFTQVGPILIALNPFFHGFPCYGQNWQDAFHKVGRQGGIASAWRMLGPHCFGTIEQVYQDLKKAPQQGVVICGESGAGKTFTNKLMLDYLLDKGGALERVRARSKSVVAATTTLSKGKAEETEQTKKSVEAANELLEAFGNAKTGRNDNSSRFGKFTQLFFAPGVDGQLLVSYPKVQTYLLERSRVVSVPDSERGYHIMHYLATDKAQKELLGTSFKPVIFNYIKGAMSVTKNESKDGVPVPFNDTEGYDILKRQMKDAGFNDEYTQNVFKLISGVMYLGNCDWSEGNEEAEQAPTLAAASSEPFTIACVLLGLDQGVLQHALTHKMKPVTENGKLAMKLLPVFSKHAVLAQRDAIAKAVYSLLFDDIVAELNQMLSKSKQGGGMYIGMLDIFGFEDMPKNGFEQMFINLTNETIQQFFNDVFFTMELSAYEAEGITVDASEVKQNCQPTLDLFGERSKGLIYLLHDQARAQKPQDGEKLVSMFNTKFEKAYDGRYKIATPSGDSIFKKTLKNKESKWKARGLAKLPQVDYKECFVVEHYAGRVIYTVEEFAQKSKDKMEVHLAEGLSKSSNAFLAKLSAPEDAGEGGGGNDKKKDLSVGLKFKESLDSLLTTLKAGPSVFVRCIKPKARPDAQFNVEEVYEQLKTGGVISALDIRSKGFPDRKDYVDFINEFWCLERGNFGDAESRDRTTSPKDRSAALLGLFVGEEGNSTYQLGHTKAFMKTGILARLREAKEVIKMRCARLVKRKWRALQVRNMAEGIESMEDRVRDADEQAQAQQVRQVGCVEKAHADAKEALKKCDETLKEDQDAHDVLVNRTRVGIAKIDEQKLVDLKGRLDSVYNTALSKVDALDEIVKKVVERKASAQAKIANMIAEKNMEVAKLLDRVSEVSGCCKNLKDPKQAEVFATCEKTKQLLQETIDKKLPETSRTVLESVDLDVDSPTISLPASVAEMLGKTKESVINAEQAGADLLAAKKAFEYEAYEVEKDLHEKRSQAKERLKQLEEQSKAAVKQGFRILADAIATAEELDEEVEQLREASTDAPAFIAKIKEYLEAEQVAREAVEKVEKLKAEKADRDKLGRRKVFTDFSGSKEILELYTTFMSQITNLSKHVDDLDKRGVDGISGESTTRENLRNRIVNIQESLQSVNFEVMSDEKATEGLGFQYKGPWSAERFKLLGPEFEPYSNLGTLLDTEAFSKIVDAVEALNSGCVPMDDGYCIGWSATWGRYYLLFTEEAEETALEALAQTQIEIQAAEREKKMKGFRKMMSGAIRALEAQKWQATIDKQQEELEERIRTNVKHDLETAFNSQVEEGIQEKTSALTIEGRSQVAAAAAKQQEFMTAQQQEEIGFKERIEELHRLLERVEVKTGINGQLPALYALITDIEINCQKLKVGCEEVRDCAALQLQDAEEAYTYAEELARDPEVLPNLKDFVEALTRSQKRLGETEKAALKLGLEGQYPELSQSRSLTTQVAMRIKKVCEGSVVFGAGLEEELDYMLTELSSAKEIFERLHKAFADWSLRLDNASAFLERGMGLIDVQIDHIEHVQDLQRPGQHKHKTMWEKMVSGMEEHFMPADSVGSQSKRGGGGLLKLEGTSGGLKQLVKHTKQEPSSPQSPNVPPNFNTRTKKTTFHIEVGDTVEDLHTKQLRGVVRFLGKTSFASGDWVGLELDTPIGKNDGSVCGQAYFKCPPKHGLFIRPASVVKVFGHSTCGQVGARPRVSSPSRSSSGRLNDTGASMGASPRSSTGSPKSRTPRNSQRSPSSTLSR